MEQDLQMTRAIRDAVIGAQNHRLLAARQAFRMGATDMIALSQLFVQGTCRPGGFATRLQITSPSVTELVDRLQRAGLVDRTTVGA
ncbi:MAG: MarR family transcriptional regulator [Pseudonocardia sp.]|uniref:MarR family transcriptional regulator n=1 Tax=Pseudonocardia sp. TaxID=60912 RepID=UPI001AC6B38C|nr:MarR family transcriptional regulator [Pseudonocardia sp.]MBN9098256.1 MarR family transcriptional regulator [Pseudonocardia sp.]